MKSRFSYYGLALLMFLSFSSQIFANELKIIPKSGSGLFQRDLTGIKVTLDGASVYSGILDDEGLVKSSTGKSINIKPGDYTLSFTLDGYKPAKFEVIIPKTPEGLPILTVSREISLIKLPPPPVEERGPAPRFKSFMEDEEFWGYVMVILLLLIAVLVIVLLFILMRRRSLYMGGAAAAKDKPKLKASKTKSKAPPAEYDDGPIASKEQRFTGKRFGKYLVTKTIARGGMAYVLEAEFEKGGGTQKAALKIPYENYQEDKEFVNRFNQEAELGDILFHENIIQLYEYGKAETGTKFIAMEYVDGTDLRKLIEKEGILEPERSAKIVMDVAKALDYAHSQNPPVYHRDIKPENVMFKDKKGQSPAILTDFGIATQGGTMGTGKALIGTALYSCPDAAKGHPVSPGYDIYSLGVVFYELLTGEVPFSGPDFYTIMRRHEEVEPKPPREINPDVPEELEEIVLKMMEKDPKKRYKKVKELLVTLRDYLNR
ncbi:MAG: serine/threonine protein kinase [Deltaproteobacteria bacterium]|uniref:Serine/threonine protein kinase n=1 Tax=Candidatus Zymogenus saltonus TaxID=2844893 RepID=A0A9D8PPP6_9DELT|nr:serine/threonine protein kinase [Candidatus Zymogenus saltonus]